MSQRSFVLRTEKSAPPRVLLPARCRKPRGSRGTEHLGAPAPCRSSHAPPPCTRPGCWERVRVRASPTRHASHLAPPPRPRWKVAANYSSGSASSRIPSSPASHSRARARTTEAAAIVRGLPVRAGAGETLRRPVAPRRGGGGLRARRGEGVR